MAILRKACRKCTSSKRKCVVQLPKCTRCAQKGLECVYDLDHLNAPNSSQQLDYDSPGYCVMKTVESLTLNIDPAVCTPGHEDALQTVRLGYRSVPGLIRAGKPAVFVHPGLQLKSDYEYFSIFEEMENGIMSYEKFQRLTQVDVKTVPVKEALAAHQGLLIYLATFLFSSDEAEQTNSESHLSLLSEWTQNLLDSAQKRMPRNQSLWQDWLFGESVRRTIIMSHALAFTLSSFKYGYCSNWVFLESLPFDRRAGLWMAQSPQAWIAAAGVRTGEEVGEQLNSFHEFAEKLEGSDPTFHGDSFLHLLVFSHNGSKRNHSPGPRGN